MSPTRFRLNDLRPGWYWIEAFVKNVGVQEVLRYVPDSPSEARIHPLVEDWEYSNGIFELPSINIFNFDDSAPELEVIGQKYCRIDGGSFKKEGEKILEYAGDTRPDLMKGTNLVPSFYMAPHEVTNQQYHAVVDRSINSRFEPYSEKYRNLPASALNAYRAARYCEMVGGRLMSYREYVFVATNAGTTKRPWGDGAERLHFSESAVGSVEFDKPLEGPEIFGLCSGVSEWTLDFFTHPNMDEKFKSREMFATFSKTKSLWEAKTIHRKSRPPTVPNLVNFLEPISRTRSSLTTHLRMSVSDPYVRSRRGSSPIWTTLNIWNSDTKNWLRELAPSASERIAYPSIRTELISGARAIR